MRRLSYNPLSFALGKIMYLLFCKNSWENKMDDSCRSYFFARMDKNVAFNEHTILYGFLAGLLCQAMLVTRNLFDIGMTFVIVVVATFIVFVWGLEEGDKTEMGMAHSACKNTSGGRCSGLQKMQGLHQVWARHFALAT